VRVAIADDSVIVREGLARVLADKQIDVVGTAGDAEELLRLIAVENPDVAIVDIRMPPTHTDEGLVAADSIRERFPDVSVLVLSQYTDAAYALRLLAGEDRARGYLLKDRIAAIDALVDALQRVDAGECVVDSDLVQQLLENPTGRDRLAVLTKRERDVLALIAEGLTDRGIGERLWLSQSTVETHVRHILRKLELPAGTSYNRRVAAVLAYLDL
jgi:DNA-binding NarL/FixJ family response regulator